MPTSTDSSRTASDALTFTAPAPYEAAVDAVLTELRLRLPARGALEEADADARAAAAAADPGEASRVAVTTLLAEALVENAVKTEPPPAPRLAEFSARWAGIDARTLALDVAARAVGDPRIVAMPPAAAIAAILDLIRAVAPVTHISLWQRGAGRLRCVGFAGSAAPARSARLAAARFLDTGAAGSRHGLLRVMAVTGRNDAVLVARPQPAAGHLVTASMRPAARALGPVLERAGELERAAPIAETLAAASERRLERVGFDLHDGPVQSLAALIGDTRLLASQVAESLAGDPRERLVRGRVSDLQARMVALEFELRCMCHSLESPAVPCRSFERVIDHEVVAFERQSGIRPIVELNGDFTGMSDSQRIALLRIVQEALRNICEHATARSVAIRVVASSSGIEAWIVDDGRGFDVDATLAEAVRDGRLGLIGMTERVRLLGGRCELRSRPGGPSVVSVVLPRWQPAQVAA